jgi:hypothetical protein
MQERRSGAFATEESMEIELGICGFTQNRIIKISGKWQSADCSLSLSAGFKETLSRLADLHALDIKNASENWSLD